MRTKTLLLTAAALLAAGIVTSQAQPVYSQNVVGYASVATPNSGVYYMMSIPFAVGVSNGLNEVFGNNLPAQSSVLTWDAVHQTFNTAVYDNSSPNPSFPSALWYQGDDFTPLTTIPTVPAGQGFFLNLTAPGTNTFAGTIAVNVGATNNLNLPSSGIYYMVGSVIPFADSISNTTINLNNLPPQSAVLTWNAGNQSFVTTVYDNSSPNPSFPSALWYQSDDFTPTAPPSLNVGDAFFVNLQGSYVWQQTLPSN